MHKLKSKLTVFFAGAALLGTIATVGAAPLGSQFTYQGRISDGVSPLNGIYEVSATLWDAASAGALLGSNAVSVTISNGLLTLPLDFGTNVFNGDARWLSFGLRTNGSVSPFTVLNPRQSVQPTPYSITALNVNAAGISGGTVPDTRLSANVARRDQANTFNGQQIVTNGNVGIGTSTPSAKLDVVGTVKATAFTGSGSALTALDANNLASGSIPLGRLPPAVVTNGASGLSLAGAFTGNGMGISNVLIRNLLFHGVVAWGRNTDDQTTVPAGLSGVQAIAAGGAHGGPKV